jgi:hypothetical protein
MNENTSPFGAPGIEPRWTSSAKDGIATAYHSSFWCTLSYGIVNEIYFPSSAEEIHGKSHRPSLRRAGGTPECGRLIRT